MTGISAAHQYNPKYLLEPEAVQLVMELAKLPDVLYEAKRILGAQRLLNYMFSLKWVNDSFVYNGAKIGPSLPSQTIVGFLFKNHLNFHICHFCSESIRFSYSSTKIKKALKRLNVKGDSDPEQQAQRMLLFKSAKNALCVCMKLISVTPLEKIWV